VTGPNHREGGPRPSIVAVTLCVLIVCGAVLFGIFGPGIAQRSQLAGRLTLGELVSAAAAMNDGFLAGAMRSRVRSIRGADAPNEPPTTGSVGDSLRAALGVPAPVPDLRDAGFHLASAGPTALHSEESDSFAIFYFSPERRRGATLVLVPDDGRAFIFDDFGRPASLEPGRLVQERLDRFHRDESTALVWSDGTLLHIAIVPTEEDAASMRAALGAP